MISNLKWNNKDNGIEWENGNDVRRISTKRPPFSVVTTSGNSKLAIVFSNEEYGSNNAFIYDADGNVFCKLKVPNNVRNVICFHEIYCILGKLTAIVATSNCDFACELNEKTFEIERIYETK